MGSRICVSSTLRVNSASNQEAPDLMSETATSAAAGLLQTVAPPRTRRRINWLPYALVLPIVVFECVMIVFPILQGVLDSFRNIELASNRPTKWVGLAN